jgi:hypothetical protein
MAITVACPISSAIAEMLGVTIESPTKGDEGAGQGKGEGKDEKKEKSRSPEQVHQAKFKSFLEGLGELGGQFKAVSDAYKPRAEQKGQAKAKAGAKAAGSGGEQPEEYDDQ